MYFDNKSDARNAAQVIDTLDLDSEPHKTFLHRLAKGDLYVTAGMAIPYRGGAMLISATAEPAHAFNTASYALHHTKQEPLSNSTQRVFLYSDGGPLQVLNTRAKRPTAATLNTIVLAGRGDPRTLMAQNRQSGVCALFSRYDCGARRRLRSLLADVEFYRAVGRNEHDVYELLAAELHLGKNPTR